MYSFTNTGFYDRMAYTPGPSDKIDARVLAANTAKRYAISADTKVILFGGTGDFWARFGDGTVNAVIPAADVSDGAAPEFCPTARWVPVGATHVSLIAAAACTVTLACYST